MLAQAAVRLRLQAGTADISAQFSDRLACAERQLHAVLISDRFAGLSGDDLLQEVVHST